MKHKGIILLLVVISFLCDTSCHRWKYEEVKIHGKVINGCLGTPMPSEQVSLYQVKGEFLGPGNGTVIKTVTTNSNGEYDFGGVDLRKKSGYAYYVAYLHHGITVSGFCDSYEINKNATDENINLVVFVGGGLKFHIWPSKDSIKAGDDIQIKVTNAINYNNFSCNPGYGLQHPEKVTDTITKSEILSYPQDIPTTVIGNSSYYLYITKIKNGITTIIQDTVYANQVLTYQINW